MPHSRHHQTSDQPPAVPRTVGKLIRFRPDELATIAERAGACGAPVARYIREVALGVTPRARRTEATAELIRQLARIGNNLNQLTRAASDGRGLGDAARLHALLDELVATIRRVE
jgi:hypothetical protein